jgi:O-antigen ligase
VINRRISIGLALIGAFGSLGILTSLFDPFSAAKTFLIACGAFGLFGYAAIHMFKSRTELFKGTKKIFFIAGLIFLLLFFIRAIASADRNLAFYGVVGRNSGFITYSAYVVTFILALAYIRTSVFEVLINGVLVSGVIAGFYSLLEQFGLEPWKMNQVYEGTSSLFGNPNFSGAFLSLSFVAAVWSLMYSSKKSSKRYMLPLLTLVLSGFGVYTAQALQGYISIALGSIVILLFWAFTKSKTLGIATLSVFSVSGLVAILGTLQVGPLTSLLYKGSVSERGDMWRTAFAMIKENPVFGVGIERYGIAFRQYRDLDHVLRTGSDSFSDNAHNVLLHLTSTGGLILGGAYAALTLGVAVVGIRAAMRSSGAKRAALVGSLALWIPIQAQNAISVDTPGVFIWNWIFAGAIVALAFESDLIPVAKQKPQKPFELHPLTPAVALLCGLLALGVSIKPIMAQHSFRFAFNLGVDLANAETVKAKVDLLMKAEGKDPGNATWPRYSANSLFIDKAWKESIAAGERAVAIDSQDWVSWWFIASAYEESGNRVAAIPARLKTVELDPLNTSVLLELAQNYRASGDEINFEKTKSAILRINPASPDAQAVSGL